MMFRLSALLLLTLLSILPVNALEIYRNSVRYDVMASLPGGAAYVVDGVDRKFVLAGVSGNLRLIQDHYSSCAQLVDERRQNWVKYGFTSSYGRYVSRTECQVTIESPAENKAISSYYIQIDRCDCFAALHLSYDADDRSRFMAAAPEIVGSIRRNNSGPAGPDFPAASELPEADGAVAQTTEPEDAPMVTVQKAVIDAGPVPLPGELLEPGEGVRRISRALGELSCAPRRARAPPAHTALVALSAWAGRGIRSLGADAGMPELAELIARNYDNAEMPPRDETALDAVISAHPGLIAAMERDVASFGDGLCALLNPGMLDYASELASRQDEFRSVYHGSLMAAQRLMALHGCFDAEIDGAFGPASRANWNRMRAVLGLEERGGDFTPTLTEVAELAAMPVTSAACEAKTGRGSLAVAALGFLGDAGDENGSWLERLTDDLSATMDAIAGAGEWTPWQSRLALRLFSAGYEENSDRRELMLAELYRNGVGVAVNLRAAAHWRGLSNGKIGAYQTYLAALDDPARAVDAVETLLADARPEFGGYEEEGGSEGGGMPAGPLMVPASTQISLSELAPLARLARLTMLYPAALDAVIKEAGPATMFKLAERLLEGASIDGKGAEEAARLLEAASERGASYAASRLAFMLRFGLGALQDRERAAKLVQAAAKKGDAFGLYLLARMAEEDHPDRPEIALAAYKRMLQSGADGIDFQTRLVLNRILNGSPALASIDGDKLVEKAGMADGKLFMCTDCGGFIDLAEAARLLRGSDSRLPLFRLLSERPDLAKSPAEAIAVLESGIEPPEQGSSNLIGTGSDVRSFLALSVMAARQSVSENKVPEAISQILDRICEGSSTSAYFCEEAAQLLASGDFGARLAAPGIARLKAIDSILLIDVLAAYGDFGGALDRALRAEKASDFRFQVSRLKGAAAPVFRRLLASRLASDMATLPDGLADLLRFHARYRDVAARQYLELIDLPRASAGPRAIRDQAETAEAYQRVVSGGGLSRALVHAARDYSEALHSEGDQAGALRLELTALSAELQLDAIDGFGRTAFGSEPLDAALTRVCHLSRASERSFALGADDIALVLAKDAINTLQTIRGEMSNVPERLQTCFRDLMSDNYRWLADLLVRQDRLGEAQFVLGLLKDYETFQFTGRDGEFAGETFAQLPYSPQEQALKDALASLSPPTVPEARRAAQLRAQDRISGLSSQQRDELAAIEARIATARQDFETGIAEITGTVAEMPETAASGLQSGLTAVDAYVTANADEQAAALYYIVLPGRLSVIVTTRQGRSSHSITEWDEEPFSEERLNSEIAAFHEALSDPELDPLPKSRKLYDLLVAPVAEELRRSDTRLLLLSLDKRLRYLPFGALNDGTDYLVEIYETSILTNSGHEVSGAKITGIPFAALGMTQETEEFVALPGVAIEIDGIVKGENGFGLFDGDVKMDAAFDRPALGQALLIGEPTTPGVGVVHVSSHFALGDTDQDSFLLLGTGEHLSLRDIKQDRATFDFEHVELLTLSACTTGFANPGRDGREIDSLAKITSDRGAKSTLASLWPVADAATAILMQRFYELRELGGMSKARALAVAQREFLDGLIGSPDNLTRRSVVFETAIRTGERFQEKAAGIDLHFTHPYYWAPFVLTGNWR